MVSRFVYWSRAAYLAAAVLTVAGILWIVFMAGMSLFSSSALWTTHKDLGYSAGFLALTLIVLAFPSRLPRSNTRWLIALLVLYIVQTMLPVLRDALPAAAALHPVNAMLVFGTSVANARAAWSLFRATRRGTVAASPVVRAG